MGKREVVMGKREVVMGKRELAVGNKAVCATQEPPYCTTLLSTFLYDLLLCICAVVVVGDCILNGQLMFKAKSDNSFICMMLSLVLFMLIKRICNADL